MSRRQQDNKFIAKILLVSISKFFCAEISGNLAVFWEILCNPSAIAWSQRIELPEKSALSLACKNHKNRRKFFKLKFALLGKKLIA